ncbi:site-specific integrase [uncultured Sunxiuqinia sp.]|uniref:tyrosine-type recombinase/integrase n=1 Tax=uncultured Sunxiuqinia sp. TaxID=1573825 RepID=UPI00262E7A96|nr:site-specific integrase [uncultured Sunxiuqinia sp.]
MRRNKIAILPEVNNCGGDLSKKWFVYYSYRDPRNGKMKRFKAYQGLHKIKDFAGRTEAAEKLKAEYAAKLKNGWSPFLADESAIYEDQLQYQNVARIYGKLKMANKTVSFYCSKFIAQKKADADLEPETISTYTSKLRIFSLWLDKNGMGDYDITVIGNDIVLQFFDYLINDRKLAGNSIKKYRQLLQDMFEFARKAGSIMINPVYDIPVCKRINDQSPRPIAEFDIQDLKDAIKKEDPQLWLAISFEYYCFLRPGKELRLLRVGEIDFVRGVIDVEQLRAKTNLERFPTIPLVFLKELREVYQLQDYPRDYYVFGKHGKPGPEFLGKNNMRTRFRNIRKKLKMPDGYKYYSWKHTGNGRAADAGISMKALQDQNGHTSIQTTEIYMRHKIGRVSEEIRDNFPEL